MESQTNESIGSQESTGLDSLRTKIEGQTAEGKIGGSPPPDAYTPTYKVKVGEKEYEFDERIRGSIKDKDTEDHVRSLYQRFHEYDDINGKYTTATQQAEQYRQYIQSVQQNVQHLQNFAQNDIGRLFESLNIPEERIIEFVRQRLQLTPEAQQAEQARRQAYDYQTQNQQLQAQQHNFMMQSAMSAPDVQKLAQSFDQRSGKQGAFLDFIDSQGSFLTNRLGRYVQPHEVVQHIMQNYGGVFSPSEPQQQAGNQIAPNQGASAAPQPVTQTIPNMGQSSQSPTRKRFKDLDALRKHINETTR